MSSASKYPRQHMMTSDDIIANVEDKVKHYLVYPKNDEQELKLIVYGDDEPVSFLMWKSILRDDLPNIYYSTVFPLIPTPAGGTREHHKYENELRKYISFCVANKNLLYGLYNVAAPKEEPRMHLVLLNRKLKRSELGRWAQTDKLVSGPDQPTSQRNLNHLSAFREQSILTLILNTEGGGTSSFLAFTEAYLRERYPPGGGESVGMMSLLVRSCQDSSFSDLSLTDSGEVIRLRTTEGSSRESSAGDRSSGGSAASLSFESTWWVYEHYGKFIPIHRLWIQVWNLLDFFPLKGEPVVSTSTSSSVEDICPSMAEMCLVPSDGRPTEPSFLEDDDV